MRHSPWEPAVKLVMRITIILIALNILVCAGTTFGGPVWHQKVFNSLPFLLLQGLLIAGIVVCICMHASRWARRRATLLLHLGLLTIALGGVLTYFLGHQGSLQLPAGTSSQHFVIDPAEAGVLEPFGFTVTLDRLDVQYYPHSELWRSITSYIRITDDEGTRHVEVSVNKPVSHHGFRIYQMGFDKPEPDSPGVSHLLVTRESGYIFVYIGCGIVCVTLVVGLLVRRGGTPN